MMTVSGQTNGWMDKIQEIIKSIKLDSENIRIQLFFNDLLEFSTQVKALKPLGRGRAMLHQKAELKILTWSLFLQAVQKHYDSSPRPGLEDMIESIMEPINNYHSSSSPLLLSIVGFFFLAPEWMNEWMKHEKKMIPTMEFIDFWDFAKWVIYNTGCLSSKGALNGMHVQECKSKSWLLQITKMWGFACRQGRAWRDLSHGWDPRIVSKLHCRCTHKLCWAKLSSVNYAVGGD